MHETHLPDTVAEVSVRARRSKEVRRVEEPGARSAPAEEPVQLTRCGLCDACVHARTCQFPLQPRPVLFCEEFEGAPSALAAPRVMPVAAAALRAETVASPHVKGLCVTCKWRDTCTYPKPEGGVWHCGEFE